jgi:multiple sugar transport system permease protein
MLLPYLGGTFLLIGIPALLAIVLSFTRTDMMTPSAWVNFDNYTYIANYPAFQAAVRNTVTFIVLAVPFRLLAMIVVSLALYRIRPGTRLYRVIVYLPTIMPEVAYAIVWSTIFNPIFGPVNVILGGLGLPQPVWIADRSTVWILLLVMSMFQIGEGLVVLLAGLHEIPEEYYSAAEVDGAGAWQKFRFITLPLLRPWLVALTFRDITFGAQTVFVPALTMFGGDRYFTHWYLPQMVYEEAFSRIRFGVASTAVVIWLAAGAILFFLAYRFARGWGYADDLQ